MPKLDEWLPAFGVMLATTYGLDRLQRYVLIGMHAWGVDLSIVKLVPAAFASAGFINRLAHFIPAPRRSGRRR